MDDDLTVQKHHLSEYVAGALVEVGEFGREGDVPCGAVDGSDCRKEGRKCSSTEILAFNMVVSMAVAMAETHQCAK